MPIDFAEIIRDEKSYPDELELSVNGQKVPLGAIRDLSKKQQKYLADQLAMVQRDREAVVARQREVEDMAGKATAIFNELQQQQSAATQQSQQAQRAAAAQANGGYDPENEYVNGMWYTPIRKRAETWEQSIKKNADDLAILTNAVRGLVNFYTDDRMGNEFEATAESRKKSKQIADWDYDQLKKYVEENKIQDRRGMPSIKEAVNRLTAEERRQVDQEDAYQKGLREGEMRARLGNMPRPASAAGTMNSTSTQTPSTIDEALSPENIGQDQELMQMLSDLSRAGADLTTGGSR